MADLQAYAILFLIWLWSMILFRSIFRKYKTKSRLPPSPWALPIIGHLHLLAPIPHQALHKLSARFGPLIHLRLGSVPCIVACSPEIAKELLKTHETSFCDRPIAAAVDYLTYGSADFSFAPYGPYWKFMKKLIMTELLGGQTLNQFLPIRSEEISQFMLHILMKAKACEAVDVGRELIMLTNNVISRMTMGQICSNNKEKADEVRKLVLDTAELTGRFNLADYIWFCKRLDLQGFGKRLKEVRDKFDAMMERIIKEHEEARKINKQTGGDYVPKDLLDILLDKSVDENSEMKLTRENIKAFILDIFAAGTDTSAITIEWALAELINHPEMMKKAREEIESVVGNNRLVEESDIINLPYLQSIIKETLRLHPTGPMSVRESTEICTINGYEIPAKTRVFINLWAINRDANHWENPLEFRPERFIGGDGKSQLDVRGQYFHFLPFGTGRRACPGISLALLMVQSTLAVMIQCFDWKIDGGDDDDGTVDMEEGPGLTLPRANPLICVPVTRISPLALSR